MSDMRTVAPVHYKQSKHDPQPDDCVYRYEAVEAVDAALARAEQAEGMVATVREALDHLYRATYESDEIIDGDCAGVVTRPNPEWRPFPSLDALRAALTDTAAAAEAHDERVRLAERQRIAEAVAELPSFDDAVERAAVLDIVGAE